LLDTLACLLQLDKAVVMLLFAGRVVLQESDSNSTLHVLDTATPMTEFVDKRKIIMKINQSYVGLISSSAITHAVFFVNTQ
jgi:hypothetical protein